MSANVEVAELCSMLVMCAFDARITGENTEGLCGGCQNDCADVRGCLFVKSVLLLLVFWVDLGFCLPACLPVSAKMHMCLCERMCVYVRTYEHVCVLGYV